MKHRTRVYEQRRRFRGECECGWRGRWRPRRAEAGDDASMHKLERRYGST